MWEKRELAAIWNVEDMQNGGMGTFVTAKSIPILEIILKARLLVKLAHLATL